MYHLVVDLYMFTCSHHV